MFVSDENNYVIGNPTPTAIYDEFYASSQKKSLYVEGKLVVNGIDILKTVSDLADILGYVAEDPELVKKYDGLKEASKKYQEIVEMYRTHNMIDNPYGE